MNRLVTAMLAIDSSDKPNSLARNALLRYAQVIGLWLAMHATGSSAIELPETTRKLQLANEIDKAYVVPLHLKGKPAAQAIEALLADGFRCQLQYASEIVPTEPPLSRCVKLPSGFGEMCNELIVTLRFEPQREITSQSTLLERLDTIKVASALPFCPFKRRVSTEYFAGRIAGEEALARDLQAVDPTGNAKALYGRLLVDGYSCGFEVTDAGSSGSMPKMICTKVPSKVKLCFESRLIVDIKWPADASSAAQLMSLLKYSEVKSVRSSCELSTIEGRGARMATGPSGSRLPVPTG